MNQSMRQDRFDQPAPKSSTSFISYCGTLAQHVCRYTRPYFIRFADQYVKIYNLSKSQCGRKIHRSVFQNNVNFDLISQFISQKHIANAGKSDERLGRFSSKTVDNLNQSSSTNLGCIEEQKVEDVAVHENKGCDIFQDSLVSNRNSPVDKSNDAFAVTDSCSSFSSHSGRFESKETRDIGLPSDRNSRCTEFARNKYFESAKSVDRELHKKRKFGRKCAIKIMDRSMQTSSSDADSAISPPGSTNNEVSLPPCERTI